MLRSRASLAPGRGANKDPRNIQDKYWKRDAQEKLRQFLETHGFERTLSNSELSGPSKTLFEAIAHFLFSKTMPNFQFHGSALATRPRIVWPS